LAESVYDKLCSVLPRRELFGGAVEQSDIMIQVSKIRSDLIRGKAESAFNMASKLFNKYRSRENILDIYIAAGVLYIQSLMDSQDHKKMMDAADSLFANASQVQSVQDVYVMSLGLFVFISKDIEKINEEKEKLLTALESSPESKRLKQGIGLIYHGLAMAEIRDRNYKSAVELLTKGLEYYPDNYELTKELDLTKELVRKKAR